MQTNWSVILNIVLLAGVVMAIMGMLKARKPKKIAMETPRVPAVKQPEAGQFDDIIAIRKVTPFDTEDSVTSSIQTVNPALTPSVSPSPKRQESAKPSSWINGQGASLMIFLLAKEQRQLGGYELLQMVLAAGLRFGEGQIFHRHQHVNGQGPVMCSLAAATESGTFDLDHIGAFTVRGLCLFMQASGNSTIDAERFEIMLDTAKQLSEGLDTYLLDDKRMTLSDASVDRYHQMLGLTDVRIADEVC